MQQVSTFAHAMRHYAVIERSGGSRIAMHPRRASTLEELVFRAACPF
jgi:hypothetical protein